MTMRGFRRIALVVALISMAAAMRAGAEMFPREWLAVIAPETGRVLGLFHLDGLLYVTSYWPPRGLTEGLQRQVMARYRHKLYGTSDVQMLPYENRFFARTETAPWTSRRYAVWEQIGARWSWIFDYRATLPRRAVDRLYRKHGFSAGMQRRLMREPIQ